MKKLIYCITLFSAQLITSGCVSDYAQTDCNLPVYTYDFSGRTFVDRRESLQANQDVNLDIPYIKEYTPVLFTVAPIIKEAEKPQPYRHKPLSLNFHYFPRLMRFLAGIVLFPRAHKNSGC